MRLRRLGWNGGITLIGDEPRLPYHRLPLSKDYLRGAKEIGSFLLASEASYHKYSIELRLGEPVIGIAVDAINSPRDFVQGKKLILANALLDPEKAADSSIPLIDAAHAA
jgi:NAD(P)H-nitrite reductase large subunit